MKEELPERYFYAGNRVKKIGQLLKGVLPRRNTADKTYQQILNAWKQIVSDKTLHGAEVVSFKKGVLYVCVESPVLIHHLTNFEKNAIISGINRIVGTRCIDDIRFKAGTFK